MTLREHMRHSLSAEWYVRIKTNHPDGDSFDGIVTHVGVDFVVLREAISFEFDGFVVLPLSVITKVRDGKFERCANAILRHNGLIDEVGALEWLGRCESLRDVLEQLRERDDWPAVEIVFNKGKSSALYLGPIGRTSGKHFGVHCYDAAGQWEKVYRLPYRQIFKIEIDSAYCRHFNAYMRSHDGTELAHAAERAQRGSTDSS